MHVNTLWFCLITGLKIELIINPILKYYLAQFLEPFVGNFSMIFQSFFQTTLKLRGHGEIIRNISVRLCWAQRKWAAESVSFITPHLQRSNQSKWAQISLEWTPGQHIHKYTESATVNTHSKHTCIRTHTLKHAVQTRVTLPTHTQGQYNKSIIGCKSSVWAPLYHTPTPLSPPALLPWQQSLTSAVCFLSYRVFQVLRAPSDRLEKK